MSEDDTSKIRLPGMFKGMGVLLLVLAVIAFIVSTVSAPMIFDGRTDTKTAILTSIKAVRMNPGAMALWAVLIAVLTAAGFATFLIGLAIVLPLLGHATWHAYKDLVA